MIYHVAMLIRSKPPAQATSEPSRPLRPAATHERWAPPRSVAGLCGSLEAPRPTAEQVRCHGHFRFKTFMAGATVSALRLPRMSADLARDPRTPGLAALCPWSALELCNHFDGPDDLAVELVQLLGRNPVLDVDRPAYLLGLELREVCGVDAEARNVPPIACARIVRVPVSSDLLRVLLIQDGIEDGLFRKSWRERSEAALPNELKFF